MKLKKSWHIWENTKFVIKSCAEYDKKLFLYAALSTMANALIPFIGIFLPKLLIDELMGNMRIPYLLFYLGVALILGCTLNYVASYANMAQLSHAVNVRMQNMLQASSKCMEMDFKETENPQTLNDVQTAIRATSNNNSGLEGMIHTLFNMAGNILAFGGYITIILTLHPLLLLLLAVNVLISFYFAWRVRQYEHNCKDEISLSDRKCEYLNNIMSNFAYGKDIRMFDLVETLCGKFKKATSENVDISRRISTRYFLADLADVILILIRDGSAYLYLIYQVLNSYLSIGNFTMYFSSISGFDGWMRTVMQDLASLNAQSLSVSDLRSFLEKSEEDDGKTFQPIPFDDTYEIILENISFRYPNSSVDVIHNLSLTIPKGQRLALVGLNGAGKTTLVKLIARLYEPTDGRILLNGIDIKKFCLEEYYQLISAVFQDTEVFPFSASENVAVCSEADDLRVENAMKDAGIYEKLIHLEDGLDTCLQKIIDIGGTNLSGGEKQKVTIARALYKNGKLTIMDEPTASLDPIAEFETYQNFDKLIQNNTAIYISHRLASTRFCNKIALLENGTIIEYGSHDELLSLNGKYSELFQIQAHYYAEGGTL